jgi:hypothetical protein
MTLYDTLKAAWKVARKFEFHSLRQRVCGFRDSPDNWAKSTRLAGTTSPRSTGELLAMREMATFGDFSPWAFSAVDLGFAANRQSTLKLGARLAKNRLLRTVVRIRESGFALPSLAATRGGQ